MISTQSITNPTPRFLFPLQQTIPTRQPAASLAVLSR
jgi:hypothetical protein